VSSSRFSRRTSSSSRCSRLVLARDYVGGFGALGGSLDAAVGQRDRESRYRADRGGDLVHQVGEEPLLPGVGVLEMGCHRVDSLAEPGELLGA
jgi:hypothetical protein